MSDKLRKKSSDNGDVTAALPYLVGLLAVPSPPQHVLSRRQPFRNENKIDNFKRRIRRTTVHHSFACVAIFPVAVRRKPGARLPVVVARHGVAGPCRSGGGRSFRHVRSSEIKRFSSIPPEHLLADKFERDLVELVLNERSVGGGQAIEIPTAMVSFDGPSDLDDASSAPHSVCRHGREDLCAPVAKLGVGCIHVNATKSAVGWKVPACHTTRVKDRRVARPAPWRVVIPIIIGSARRVCVHGAFQRVAECSGDVRLVACVEFAPPLGPAVRDRSSRISVALLAADRASIREPEAGLAVGSADLALLVGHRAPSSERLDAGRRVRHRSIPRREGPVDRVPGARFIHSAMGVGQARMRKQGKKQHHLCRRKAGACQFEPVMLSRASRGVRCRAASSPCCLSSRE